MSSDSQGFEKISGVTARSRLRAPTAIAYPDRLLKLNHFSSYVNEQNKFRIINPAATGLRKPLQRLEQATQQGASGENVSQISSRPATRPTPTKPVGPGSLATPATTVARPTRIVGNIGATLEKPKALNRVQLPRPSPRSTFQPAPAPRQTPSKVPFATPVAPTPASFATPTPSGAASKLRCLRTTKTTTSVVTAQCSYVTANNELQTGNNITNIIDLSSVEDDVGQIRKLLEQLLPTLVESHRVQDELAAENERLRSELALVKFKLKAFKKASSLVSG